MVKVILDIWGDNIEDQVSKLKDALLIITQKCKLSAEVQKLYTEIYDLSEIKLVGNFIFRTSDDFVRGLILGKIIVKFPDVIIYSTRAEVIQKYLSQKINYIEPWPNDLNTYIEHKEFTLQGPDMPMSFESQLYPSSFEKMSELKNMKKPLNIPRPPEKSDKMSYVQPMIKNQENKENPGIFPKASAYENLALSPPEKFIRPQNPSYSQYSTPKVPEISPNKQISNPIYTDMQDDNSPIIKENLESIINITTSDSSIFRIKNLGDLYSLVFRNVRNLAEKNEKLADNDRIRLRLESLAQKRILEFGFFEISGGMSIDQIVDEKKYKVPLKFVS
ncbi:hypothetical protein SteCoe_18064 [Stentor coeruleus]|uniref:Uncharacterized protein n=1 Tax=Stentor coeruleus TaxID=5963 RepID=A0A1R2BXC5_9CILI|nr:hypothetical protein SteCoe_18064 [Stentor coeruleus]